MVRAGAALLIGAAVAGLGLVLLASVAQPTRGAPSIVSMAESARAMERAGQAMIRHGASMGERGRATGATDLMMRGERWQLDGWRVVQGGRWMAMDPLAPASLASTPAGLAASGDWGRLVVGARAMLHDPARAGDTNLDALRWNGEAMRAEGATMAEHGRRMATEVELMASLENHDFVGVTAAELTDAAASLERVGRALERNGQAMIAYVVRLRRSIGAR